MSKFELQSHDYVYFWKGMNPLIFPAILLFFLMDGFDIK